MRKALLTLFILSFFIQSASSFIINPAVYFSVDNETYSTNASMIFNTIIVNSHYLVFNSTGWNITSSNAIAIRLIKINTSTSGGSSGNIILRYNATAVAGTSVWFNISGMKPNTAYNVTRDGVIVGSFLSSAGGVLSFNNAIWSGHVFNVIFARSSGSGSASGISGGSGRNYITWFVVGAFIGIILCSVFPIVGFNRKRKK